MDKINQVKKNKTRNIICKAGVWTRIHIEHFATMFITFDSQEVGRYSFEDPNATTIKAFHKWKVGEALEMIPSDIWLKSSEKRDIIITVTKFI